MFILESLRLNIATLSLSTTWAGKLFQTLILRQTKVQVRIYIRVLFEYLKIAASSTGCITINDTEKSVTVNIDKTTNNTKYHS